MSVNTQTHPLISIVIPAYNYPEYLKMTLQSVTNQTYANIEILVIDDGSEAKLYPIIKDLNDKRICYHKLPHKNANVARNYGIEKSKGDFIAMLDSDDLWLTNHLESCYNLLQEEQADGLYGSLTLQNNATGQVRCITVRPLQKDETMIDYLLSSGYGAQTSTLFMTRKSAKSTLWDGRLNRHQDYDFVIRYNKQFRLIAKTEATVTFPLGRNKQQTIDFESCIKVIRDNKEDISPNIYYRYNLNMLNLALSQDAPDKIIEYYKNAINTHKEDEILSRIANHLIIHSSFIKDISLYHGKMGIILFFVHYARYTSNKVYDDFAGELLDSIFEELHTDIPIDMEQGLCGIGWGILHLLENKFMEGDPEEILSDIDAKIMERDLRRMTDFSFENGLEGISYYINKRVNYALEHKSLIPFDATYLSEWKAECNHLVCSEETDGLFFLIKNIPEGQNYLDWKLGIMNGCAGWGLKKIIL